MNFLDEIKKSFVPEARALCALAIVKFPVEKYIKVGSPEFAKILVKVYFTPLILLMIIMKMANLLRALF